MSVSGVGGSKGNGAGASCKCRKIVGCELVASMSDSKYGGTHELSMQLAAAHCRTASAISKILAKTRSSVHGSPLTPLPEELTQLDQAILSLRNAAEEALALLRTPRSGSAVERGTAEAASSAGVVH